MCNCGANKTSRDGMSASRRSAQDAVEKQRTASPAPAPHQPPTVHRTSRAAGSVSTTFALDTGDERTMQYGSKLERDAARLRAHRD